MKRLVATTLFAAVLTLPLAAQAGPSGSRQPAGGAFMSSYVDDPYHDPRSLHSQQRGTGQLLGAPMLTEGPGVSQRRVVDPHWAAGWDRKRVR